MMTTSLPMPSASLPLSSSSSSSTVSGFSANPYQKSLSKIQQAARVYAGPSEPPRAPFGAAAVGASSSASVPSRHALSSSSASFSRQTPPRSSSAGLFPALAAASAAVSAPSQEAMSGDPSSPYSASADYYPYSLHSQHRTLSTAPTDDSIGRYQQHHHHSTRLLSTAGALSSSSASSSSSPSGAAAAAIAAKTAHLASFEPRMILTGSSSAPHLHPAKLALSSATSASRFHRLKSSFSPSKYLKPINNVARWDRSDTEYHGYDADQFLDTDAAFDAQLASSAAAGENAGYSLDTSSAAAAPAAARRGRGGASKSKRHPTVRDVYASAHQQLRKHQQVLDEARMQKQQLPPEIRSRQNVLAYLTSPSCFLFADATEIVAVRDEELDDLVRSGQSEHDAGANIVIQLQRLDDQGRRFNSFTELFAVVHEMLREHGEEQERKRAARAARAADGADGSDGTDPVDFAADAAAYGQGYRDEEKRNMDEDDYQEGSTFAHTDALSHSLVHSHDAGKHQRADRQGRHHVAKVSRTRTAWYSTKHVLHEAPPPPTQEELDAIEAKRREHLLHKIEAERQARFAIVKERQEKERAEREIRRHAMEEKLRAERKHRAKASNQLVRSRRGNGSDSESGLHTSSNAPAATTAANTTTSSSIVVKSSDAHFEYHATSSKPAKASSNKSHGHASDMSDGHASIVASGAPHGGLSLATLEAYGAKATTQAHAHGGGSHSPSAGEETSASKVKHAAQSKGGKAVATKTPVSPKAGGGTSGSTVSPAAAPAPAAALAVVAQRQRGGEAKDDDAADAQPFVTPRTASIVAASVAESAMAEAVASVVRQSSMPRTTDEYASSEDALSASAQPMLAAISPRSASLVGTSMAENAIADALQRVARQLSVPNSTEPVYAEPAEPNADAAYEENYADDNEPSGEFAAEEAVAPAEVEAPVPDVEAHAAVSAEDEHYEDDHGQVEAAAYSADANEVVEPVTAEEQPVTVEEMQPAAKEQLVYAEAEPVAAEEEEEQPATEEQPVASFADADPNVTAAFDTVTAPATESAADAEEPANEEVPAPSDNAGDSAQAYVAVDSAAQAEQTEPQAEQTEPQAEQAEDAEEVYADDTVEATEAE